MKHIRAVPGPIEHRRNRHQLYWSQNGDGDLIAHVRLNTALNNGLRAGSNGLDEIKEHASFYDSNLANDIKQNSRVPIHTDEQSASASFKIATEPGEKRAIMTGSNPVLSSDVIKRLS